MKAVVLAAACCLAAAAALSAHAASKGGPQCTPKLAKPNGKPIVYWCGPATGTLTTGGKTYTFAKGLCSQSKTARLTLELSLGVLAATTKGNAGKPFIQMELGKTGGTVSAYYGGRRIANDLVTVAGRYPSQGTFASQLGTGQKFTGSWNCHGAIYQAP
jgi:hypothetical protein